MAEQSTLGIIDLSAESEDDQPAPKKPKNTTIEELSPVKDPEALKGMYVGAKRLLRERQKFHSTAGVRLLYEQQVADHSKYSHLWLVSLSGSTGSVFEGEEFTLRIRFPKDYPMDAPEAEFQIDGKFGRPSPRHEHIYSNGHICLDLLHSGWSPAMSVESVCVSIQSMMSSATKRQRPPGDQAYSRRTRGKSSKDTKWAFHDSNC